VHRIGRTGRAGATGSAISLVDDSEIKLLKGIERLINKSVERKPLPAGWTAPVRSSAEERAELEDDRDDDRPRGGRGMRGEPRRGQGQGQGQRAGGNAGSRNGSGGNHRGGAKPAQPSGHGRAAQPQGDRREQRPASQPARRPEGARPQQANAQPRRAGALLSK
jgi:ATP-dependent RNA helicase RhlE